MADKKFKLQIVTPNRLFYEDEVDRVMFRTTEGDLCVLRDHIPLTTPLVSGLAVITKDKVKIKAVLHGGFAEIQEETVVILSDAAEWTDEIDLDRAEKAKEKAQTLLEQEHEDSSQKMMKASLMRALARIEVAKHNNVDND